MYTLNKFYDDAWAIATKFIPTNADPQQYVITVDASINGVEKTPRYRIALFNYMPNWETIARSEHNSAQVALEHFETELRNRPTKDMDVGI